MAKSQKKQKKPAEKPAQLFQPKDFLDRIAPAAVKFNTDSYVLRSWPCSPTSATGPVSPSTSIPVR